MMDYGIILVNVMKVMFVLVVHGVNSPAWHS
jgi:hypothetical protein